MSQWRLLFTHKPPDTDNKAAFRQSYQNLINEGSGRSKKPIIPVLFSLFRFIPTRSRNLFLKQLCLEIICSSSSKNFDYPYYQSYTMGAYQNLIIGDKLSQEAHSSYYRWLVCILAYPCQVFQTISGIFERIKHAHSILANLSANSATIVLAPTIRLCPAYAGQTHAQPWNRRAYTIRQKTVLPHPSNRMRTLC